MAGDWIKMRTDLYRDPKVILIADHLMGPRSALSRYVSQNLQRDMSVTRNVTRNAVVGALVTVWGVMRHQGARSGDDLLLSGCSLAVIDDIAELQGFGEAMASAGWLTEGDDGLYFPRFFAENNTDPKTDQKVKNAERQKRYRESKKEENRNVTRNVTRDAKSNAREREEREKRLTTEAPSQERHQEHIIPKKLDDDECHAAAAKWFAYLNSKGLEDKNPDGNEIALEEWWRQMGKLSRADFLEAVSESIAGGRWNVTKSRSAHGRSSKAQSEDWIEVQKAVKRFPDDWQKRKEMLGDARFEALKRLGSSKVADANDFELKSLEQIFESHLKDVNNGKS